MKKKMKASHCSPGLCGLKVRQALPFITPCPGSGHSLSPQTGDLGWSGLQGDHSATSHGHGQGMDEQGCSCWVGQH